MLDDVPAHTNRTSLLMAAPAFYHTGHDARDQLSISRGDTDPDGQMRVAPLKHDPDLALWRRHCSGPNGYAGQGPFSIDIHCRDFDLHAHVSIRPGGHDRAIEAVRLS
jgi:hypothetical protein